ncbi:MAG: ArsA family ATPase [Solirubrobacteraceae bacterium]
MSAHALSPPDSRPAAAATVLSILERRMAFVTGKGGVGKTTVSAALAFAALAHRRPAVVCELGTRAQLARTFGQTDPRAAVEVELAPGLGSISIDPDTALQEWMARTIGRPGAALLGRSDAFRYFVAAAPGARELVGIGKAWDLTRSRGATRDGRLVVVDAPSSGHAVGLLQAPRTYSRLGGPGPIGHQARRIRDFLGDPARSAIVLVCTPSEMPVTETLELAAAVHDATGRPPDVVIANQVLPDRFDEHEVERIDRALSATGDPRLHAVARPARMAWRRAREQEDELDRLRAELGLPIVELPFLFVAALGPRDLRALSTALAPPAA